MARTLVVIFGLILLLGCSGGVGGKYVATGHMGTMFLDLTDGKFMMSNSLNKDNVSGTYKVSGEKLQMTVENKNGSPPPEGSGEIDFTIVEGGKAVVDPIGNKFTRQ